MEGVREMTSNSNVTGNDAGWNMASSYGASGNSGGSGNSGMSSRSGNSSGGGGYMAKEGKNVSGSAMEKLFKKPELMREIMEELEENDGFEARGRGRGRSGGRRRQSNGRFASGSEEGGESSMTMDDMRQMKMEECMTKIENKLTKMEEDEMSSKEVIVPTNSGGFGNNGLGEIIGAAIIGAAFFGNGNGFGGNNGGGNVAQMIHENALANANANGQLMNAITTQTTAISSEIQASNTANLIAQKDSDYRNMVTAKDAALEAFKCCCETNRNIDSVRAAIQQEADKTRQQALEIENRTVMRDLMTVNQALRDRLFEASQREQTNAINLATFQTVNPEAAVPVVTPVLG